MKSNEEKFWAGEFGDNYVGRNILSNNITSSTALWAKILSNCSSRPDSALEIGCNLGINLCVLKNIFPSITLEAIEINKKAAELAQKNTTALIHNCSIFDHDIQKQFDLVFTCGVMVHINPDLLDNLYSKIYAATKKYILISEYYNPTPVEVDYRGYSEKLYKRDFAGEMMDKYPNLHLINYGFVYHRDNIFPKDDLTWFLMEKKV